MLNVNASIENARAEVSNQRANVERVRNAADSVEAVVADGAKTVQAEISNIYGFGQQAA